MLGNTRSEELLRQLSTSVAPVEDAERAAARRGRVVTHLAALVEGLPEKRQRRRKLAWAASISAAAAAALVVGFASTRPRFQAKRSEPGAAPSALLALQGSVQIIHRAAEVVAPPLVQVPVASPDEVVTGPGGRARASLASGAEVDIGPETKVRLSGDIKGSDGLTSTPSGGNEAVVLDQGQVTVRVPKLGPMRSFAVETPEATVVVHGTAFSVERSTGAERGTSRTMVDVAEGSVAVRHHGVEVLLHAGDRWSSAGSLDADLESAGNTGPAADPSDTAPNKRKLASGGQRGNSAAAAKGSAGTPSLDKSSSLAEENRLLQSAMAARQQGNPHRAAQLAAELVIRFPSSPLVEEARVERMRALVGAGGAAAAAGDARSYLTDYPQGFARQEASRILAGATR
jgi:hypothetical protein